VLESESVTKYTCDCRMDCDALWHQFKVRPRCMVDLQLSEVALRRRATAPLRATACCVLCDVEGLLSSSAHYGQDSQMLAIVRHRQ
jgi:ribonuclease D